VKKLILFSSFSFAGGAFAASGGEHDPHAIPWMLIAAQAFNVAVLFGGLIFLLRAAAKKFFATRQETYLELVNRADAARIEAERGRAEIASKLSTLENNTQKSIAQADNEAAQMRNKIVNEAKELAAKMKDEASRSVKVELDKAKSQLRVELLNAAVESARASLKDKVGGPEQKKLQMEFVDKIQVVR
jgi:F-type H+-transporting ATPase subunit b